MSDEQVEKIEKAKEEEVTESVESEKVRTPDEVIDARPFYKVTFPSLGLLYSGKLPNGEALVGPWTTREEAIFGDRVGVRPSAIFELMERCLKPVPGLPFGKLLLGDAFYILMCARDFTFPGTPYTAKLQCQSCRAIFVHSIPVPEGIRIKSYTGDFEGEPFSIHLPQSNVQVDFRLLRVENELEIQSYATRILGQQKSLARPGDPSYSYRLAQHIVALDGNKADLVSSLEFCDRMLGGDSLVLRRAIRDHECGPNLLVEYTCRACGYSSEVMMPIDANFFRPEEFAA